MDKDKKEKLKKEREMRLQRVLEFFKNMKPFKTVNDIPDIPVVNSEDYQNVIIPNLIRCGAISKDELIAGETYVGACRNATEAIWNGREFTYLRTKMFYTYEEKINHFQDDDGYDLFIPLKLKEKNTQ